MREPHVFQWIRRALALGPTQSLNAFQDALVSFAHLRRGRLAELIAARRDRPRIIADAGGFRVERALPLRKGRTLQPGGESE